MSERDEERWKAAKEYTCNRHGGPWGTTRKLETAEVHLAGQLCGERRAQKEIEVLEESLREQAAEIASLREAVRLSAPTECTHCSGMGWYRSGDDEREQCFECYGSGWVQTRVENCKEYTSRPEVVRALEEGR